MPAAHAACKWGLSMRYGCLVLTCEAVPCKHLAMDMRCLTYSVTHTSYCITQLPGRPRLKVLDPDAYEMVDLQLPDNQCTSFVCTGRSSLILRMAMWKEDLGLL